MWSFNILNIIAESAIIVFIKRKAHKSKTNKHNDFYSFLYKYMYFLYIKLL